jgi:hypothetical protein
MDPKDHRKVPPFPPSILLPPSFFPSSIFLLPLLPSSLTCILGLWGCHSKSLSFLPPPCAIFRQLLLANQSVHQSLRSLQGGRRHRAPALKIRPLPWDSAVTELMGSTRSSSSMKDHRISTGSSCVADPCEFTSPGRTLFFAKTYENQYKINIFNLCCVQIQLRQFRSPNVAGELEWYSDSSFMARPHLLLILHSLSVSRVDRQLLFFISVISRNLRIPFKR